MARDAIARLYDVEDSSVVYTKPKQRGKYDHGTVAFQARKGKLIDLEKIHESVWATRLSGGTSSGLVRLDVTAIGEIVTEGDSIVLKVAGSKKSLVLVNDRNAKPESSELAAFQNVREAIGSGEQVSITGQVEGWSGRWPQVLSRPPVLPVRIVVAEFKQVQE